ncbi:hypothetical protein BDZ90DRAFT_85156 [Jaminaea rosea]|uniref:Uncharacterized protein n=1 Tax=Jaminaea rosea TaxID=1569628 RepID=A0A316UIV8_9BASI|nr:hypothetical protein BDZ90DRAFT_85156 [Jaminaea rosea]PWN25237.1 hypothetical protein BDZ90DRAFT_85156 [Jaminaea rosea]
MKSASGRRMLCRSLSTALPRPRRRSSLSALSTIGSPCSISSVTSAFTRQKYWSTSPATTSTLPGAVDDQLDEDTHPANVESLLVALFGKGRLINIEDGGSHSETAPYLLNPSMRGLLAPVPELRLLSKSYHRWSLNASGGAHGFETERRHLVRTVPLLLGRALKPGELDCCPAFENLLPASVTDDIAKGKYTEARHHSRDQAVEEKRVETRQKAHQVGMELLAKLEGKPSVLVVCSFEVQLVLRDCLAKEDPPPQLLSASGLNANLMAFSDSNQTTQLRRWIFFPPGRQLYLLRAINSTKAKHLSRPAVK